MDPISIVFASTQTPQQVLDEIIDYADTTDRLARLTTTAKTGQRTIHMHAAAVTDSHGTDHAVVASEERRFRAMDPRWPARSNPTFGITHTPSNQDPLVRVTIVSEQPGRIVHHLLRQPTTTGAPLGVLGPDVPRVMPITEVETIAISKPHLLPSGTVLLLWQPTTAQARRVVKAGKQMLHALTSLWGEVSTAADAAATDHGVHLPIGVTNNVTLTDDGVGLPVVLDNGSYWLGVVTPDGWQEVLSGRSVTRTSGLTIARAAGEAHRQHVMHDAGYHRVMLHGLLGEQIQQRTPEPATPAVDTGPLEAELSAVQAENARLASALESRQAALRQSRRELARLARALDQYEHPDGEDTPADSDDDVTPPIAQEVQPDSGAAGPLPTTPAEALTRATHELPHLVVTDHACESAAVLEGHKKVAVWAARTWSVLSDLNDYARTRDDLVSVANFRVYLGQIDNPGTNPRKVSVRESDTVMSSEKMRSERMRPVPPEIDPSGQALFVEHVRIESGGKPPAPRLYFLDDTAGESGKVVVGYVGPHLTNTKTS